MVGSASTSPRCLQDCATGEEVANLGTIKEADLEAVMACDPDVIFIGGRLAPVYDGLSQIAPVVFLSTGAEKDPEYIFVLNRDAVIVSDGADRAREVVENDLARQTQAYRNDHIVYLGNPAVWYTAGGGIEALNIMLEDLEGALL